MPPRDAGAAASLGFDVEDVRVLCEDIEQCLEHLIGVSAEPTTEAPEVALLEGSICLTVEGENESIDDTLRI